MSGEVGSAPGRTQGVAGAENGLNGALDAPSAPPQRVVTRIVLEFFVDILAAAARACEGDLKSMLVLLAIDHANTEHLLVGPMGARNALLAHPDDSQRRPITVHALSQSMRIPPETGRRYTQALMRRGFCVRVDERGLIVPNRIMALPQFAAFEETKHTAFMALLRSLDAVGFDPLAPGVREACRSPRPTLDPATARRAMSVLVTGYVLRAVIDAVDLHGADFLHTVLYATVITMNVPHITHDRKLAWRYADANSGPPDDMRRPVTVRAAAERLGLPYETTRQNLMRMIEHGDLARVPGGLIAPVAPQQTPARLRYGLNLHVWLLRVIAELYRLGFDVESARVA